MTEKLYDYDSHLFRFEATVIGVEDGAVLLDRTAFFPEGGGQGADSGSINGVQVVDVQERDGEIWHSIAGELELGEGVDCEVDEETRLRRMQSHSGEHIVSGIVHRRLGYENVGFHMGEGGMTVDFSGEFDWETAMDIEREANAVVRANLPVHAWYPAAEELKGLHYRSKKELSGPVRLVEIEGVDLCACCAPHVDATGEIGLIKIMTLERHRGGVRLTLCCGMDALDDYRRKQDNVARISALLSAKRDETAEAAERLARENEELKARTAALGERYAALLAESYRETEGNICVFTENLSEATIRSLCNALMEKCALAAVFSGSDEKGWRYIIGSKRRDLAALTREINAAISGRGGGRGEMIQGSASASQKQIADYFT